ncbi:hypothetical protein [Solimonas sp. SE-A11]|uniref:hypothetical protein n=1 Tax=Solimonas sp. SE-A11 TaxID=3054954 RepID=UPI00259CED45|nr:hypothetical protein [Solimonas sp. SE-A11]MDM4772400.1 hypothetical protein [Solimonas sp. SE-A11]
MRQISFDVDSERDYEAEALTNHQMGIPGDPNLEALWLGMGIFLGSLILLIMTDKALLLMGSVFLAEDCDYTSVSFLWSLMGAGIQWWRSNRQVNAWRHQFDLNIKLLAGRRERMQLPKLFSVSFPRHRGASDPRPYQGP